MRTGKRRIRDGHQFNRFFKRAKGKNITVKKEALVEDTVKWIKIVVNLTLEQTEEIAHYLQAERVKETCKRIWNFCFHHYQYERDEERKEQIRTPNRAWMDRHDHIGIDCDCLTVTICSILKNLNIPFVMRITKYPNDTEFSHIYPVAIAPDGQEIIIDCVVHEFNYEVAYTEKKDIEMELQILNGTPVSYPDTQVEGERYNEFGEKVSFEHDLPIDAEDLFLDADMELDGLEGKAEREARRAKRKTKRARPKEQKKADRKAKVANFKKLPLREKMRKGFHVINKVNPGAVLLRGGVLASMKINLFKVASHLRFAYWSDHEARKNNMDMNKFNQLKRIREKLEKIYFGAGGKAESLKKSILSGKGNRNRMVRLNGLGEIIQPVNDTDSLRHILGDELFFEELNGLEGLNGLGEPATIATGAAITAASGVLATIAGMIKKLGGLFKKGSKTAEQFKIQDNTDDQDEKTRKFSFKNIANKIRTKVQERRARKGSGTDTEIIDIPDDEFANDLPEEDLEIYPEDEFVLDDPFQTDSNKSPTGGKDTPTSSSPDEKEKNSFSKWISDNKVAVGIGTGVVLGGTALTIYLVNRSKKAKKPKKDTAVNGLPKTKKKSTKTNTTKKKANSKPTVQEIM